MLSASRATWAVDTAVPVGLLGVASVTSLVRSVTAAATASMSKAQSALSGTRTSVPPIVWVMIGYASKETHGVTTSSPGSMYAVASWYSSATEPAPTVTMDAFTPSPSQSAMASRNFAALWSQ